MTDEELDQWRGQEAWRRRHEYPEDATEVIAARFAREGRKPPEPVVDPDVLAFREWAEKMWPLYAGATRRGDMDPTDAARAFLAGARMAREQERERAKVPIRMAEALADRCQRLLHSLPAGVHAQLDVKWGIDALSRVIEAEIAKYRGEA